MIEAKFEGSHVNVRVERGLTFACTRDLPIYVRMHGKITRQWKSTLKLNILPNAQLLNSSSHDAIAQNHSLFFPH